MCEQRLCYGGKHQKAWDPFPVLALEAAYCRPIPWSTLHTFSERNELGSDPSRDVYGAKRLWDRLILRLNASRAWLDADFE